MIFQCYNQSSSSDHAYKLNLIKIYEHFYLYDVTHTNTSDGHHKFLRTYQFIRNSASPDKHSTDIQIVRRSTLEECRQLALQSSTFGKTSQNLDRLMMHELLSP